MFPAAYAAHNVLSTFYPNSQSNIFDPLIQKQTIGLSANQLDAAQSLAVPIAGAVVKSRQNDGSALWARYTPSPANGPIGKYQYVPNQTYAQYPQLGLNTTTFVLPSVKTYAALTKPYEIPSKQYNADYNETKAYGSKNSTVRSQYQTDTGLLWLSSTGTSTIIGYWNLVARQVVPADLSLLDTAKLLAHLNVAAYDAQIVAFYQKFTYQVWRPITAIRQGDYSNAADPTWTPLVVTPFHPDYPSTHSVASGVAQTVLTRWLGTDNATYTVTAEDGKAPPRTFTSFSDGALDSAKSRIYVGAHFPLAIYDGVTLGNKIADYVFGNLDSTVGWSSVKHHAGQGSLASAPAAAPQASKPVAAASAPAPGSVTAASVGRHLLA
ncbi:g10198 [Coccomyxa elongata]